MGKQLTRLADEHGFSEPVALVARVHALSKSIRDFRDDYAVHVNPRAFLFPSVDRVAGAQAGRRWGWRRTRAIGLRVLEELSEHLRAPETEAYVLEHADLLRRPTGAVAG